MEQLKTKEKVKEEAIKLKILLNELTIDKKLSLLIIMLHSHLSKKDKKLLEDTLNVMGEN